MIWSAGLSTAAVEWTAPESIILDKFTADQRYPERVQMLPHRRGDVRDPGLFLPASFDLITCCETLEHVGDIPAALSSMYRWLRSGAHLVGTVPIPGLCHEAGEPGITLLSEAELRSALQAAGYDRVRIEPSRSEGRPGEPPCCLYFVARKAAPP
jgi:SAM-dependent methyltransferase